MPPPKAAMAQPSRRELLIQAASASLTSSKLLQLAAEEPTPTLSGVPAPSRRQPTPKAGAIAVPRPTSTIGEGAAARTEGGRAAPLPQAPRMPKAPRLLPPPPPAPAPVPAGDAASVEAMPIPTASAPMPPPPPYFAGLAIMNPEARAALLRERLQRKKRRLQTPPLVLRPARRRSPLGAVSVASSGRGGSTMGRDITQQEQVAQKIPYAVTKDPPIVTGAIVLPTAQ